MSKLSALRLRIVPLDSLLLHEAHDSARVERLIDVLRQDGCLRNPVIVTEHQGRYVQLDGATRAIALGEMGLPCIPVQIVSYADPDICLSSWNHVLIGYPAAQLCGVLGALEGLSCKECDPQEIRQALQSPAGGLEPPAEQALLGVVSRQGSGMLVHGVGPLKDQLEHLNAVVAIYRGQAEVRRSAEVELEAIRSQHPDFSAVVAFARLSPEDVIHCAFNRAKLPMGITRHLVGGRALGVGVPLELLADQRPLEWKNAWLQDTILERIRQHKVRVYQEPVIIFDD